MERAADVIGASDERRRQSGRDVAERDFPREGGVMKARLNYAKAAAGIYDAMDSLDGYLQQCGLERSLLLLCQLRASQINGCAYCLDMHWKDLRAIGEGEQRLYSLDAWRECPYYSDRERAGLTWAEALTLITNGQVPDSTSHPAHSHFAA